MKIILASSSKQRQDIFKMIGLKYEVITSDIDEQSNANEPDKYVEELSFNKAKAVYNQLKDKAIIISADTIIYFNGKKYEKPKSKEEAFNNLKELSGNKNTAYTGITIMDLYQNKTLTFSSKVEIYFKNITEEEINWYIENENKIFKCCGYVPLGKASIFIDKVDGDYNTLFGISSSVVFEKLKELGYTINDFDFGKVENQNVK